MKPLVYLAGGIAGLSGVDAIDWRVDAVHRFADFGVEALNPMRAKGKLRAQSVISTDFHDYQDLGAFFTSRGIMTRDFHDVRHCDVLLVNLLGLVKPSLGTIMEMAWGYAFKKPAVVAIEPHGNPHDNHPMIHEAISFRVATLDDAIVSAAIILNRG